MHHRVAVPRRRRLQWEGETHADDPCQCLALLGSASRIGHVSVVWEIALGMEPGVEECPSVAL